MFILRKSLQYGFWREKAFLKLRELQQYRGRATQDDTDFSVREALSVYYHPPPLQDESMANRDGRNSVSGVLLAVMSTIYLMDSAACRLQTALQHVDMH